MNNALAPEQPRRALVRLGLTIASQTNGFWSRVLPDKPETSWLPYGCALPIFQARPGTYVTGAFEFQAGTDMGAPHPSAVGRSSAGNMHSTRSSCADAVCGVPTVLTIENQAP